MDTAGSYDELPNQYDPIFENWEASRAAKQRHSAPFSSLKCGLMSTARILDCACGIGTQALGLANVGFRVTGCDISREAIGRAQMEASRRNLDIQFLPANMLDLTCVGETDFDAVICMDNALPHLENEDQLVQAAEQMRGRMRFEGFLMASIRDYDHLIEERLRVQGPSFYSDEGRRRIVFQVWDWIGDRQYTFHLYITHEVGNKWQTFHTAAVYRALRRNEVTAALRQARFKNTRWLFPPESGFYQPIVLAEAD